MSYLQNQMNILKFDKRLLEINLKNGTITEDDYKQFLANLKDDNDNAIKLDLATEADNQKEAMNGDSHPAETIQEPTSMPTNTDPFGSGF